MSQGLDFWDEGHSSHGESNPAETPAYGSPASAEVLSQVMGTKQTGCMYNAWVFKDNTKEINKRRGIPEVTEANFFSSLVNVDGRWIFSGVLNKWEGFTTLELLSIKSRHKGKTIRKIWSTEKAKTAPLYPKNQGEKLWLTLRAPDWSSLGWSKNNKGFCWWYSQFRNDSKKFCHGENMIKAAETDEYKDSKVVRVHHFGHRYAKQHETYKDRMSYHTGVLLEWDHGQFTTIVELAWKNGIGGYGGKSNWVEDKMSGNPELFQKLPGDLMLPYVDDKSEIRMIDIICKDVEEFKKFLERYNDKTARFLDPSVKSSGKPKIADVKRKDICRYVVNRINQNREYSEPSSMPPKAGYNCQTFAANFYGFLTSTKEPCFSTVMKAVFKPNHKPFLKDYRK